jgi:xylose isomerase
MQASIVAKEKEFEQGKLTLEDLAHMRPINGEPEVRSGRQEWLEKIINRYILGDLIGSVLTPTGQFRE